MAQTPLFGSHKWNIISFSTTLQMTWPNSGMVFSIQIKNAGNGGNGEKLPVAWTQFITELYERFDTDTNHLGRLTKLNKLGTVEDFIAAFEHLAFRTEGMTDAFFGECFICGLKEEIWAHFLMARHTQQNDNLMNGCQN